MSAQCSKFCMEISQSFPLDLTLETMISLFYRPLGISFCCATDFYALQRAQPCNSGSYHESAKRGIWRGTAVNPVIKRKGGRQLYPAKSLHSRIRATGSKLVRGGRVTNGAAIVWWVTPSIEWVEVWGGGAKRELGGGSEQRGDDVEKVPIWRSECKGL